MPPKRKNTESTDGQPTVVDPEQAAGTDKATEEGYHELGDPDAGKSLPEGTVVTESNQSTADSPEPQDDQPGNPNQVEGILRRIESAFAESSGVITMQQYLDIKNGKAL